MLARLGRADPKLLSPVRHRSEETQRALVRLKVREALVRNRVNLINSVRFLLKSLGVFVSSSIKAMAFTRKVRAQLAAADVALIGPLLAAVDAINAEIKQLDADLEALALERYPVTERLRQIAGVGPLTALCFVLTLESPAHFANARAVGAYLGLVPRRDQSGQTDKQLGITKAGHVQMRCLLVNCAHYILGPFGPPCALRTAGERIAARGGKSAKKRAVIAVARKLAVNRYHFKRSRWRRLWRQQIQDWLIAAVQNIALLCGGIGAAVGAKPPKAPESRSAAAARPRSCVRARLRASNQAPNVWRWNLLWAAAA